MDDYYIHIMYASALSIALGVISSGIYTRLTRTPPQPPRGCDHCGARLGTLDGTSCHICVARRRSQPETD